MNSPIFTIVLLGIIFLFLFPLVQEEDGEEDKNSAFYREFIKENPMCEYCGMPSTHIFAQKPNEIIKTISYVAVCRDCLKQRIKNKDVEIRNKT